MAKSPRSLASKLKRIIDQQIPAESTRLVINSQMIQPTHETSMHASFKYDTSSYIKGGGNRNMIDNPKTKSFRFPSQPKVINYNPTSPGIANPKISCIANSSQPPNVANSSFLTPEIANSKTKSILKMKVHIQMLTLPASSLQKLPTQIQLHLTLFWLPLPKMTFHTNLRFLKMTPKIHSAITRLCLWIIPGR